MRTIRNQNGIETVEVTANRSGAKIRSRMHGEADTVFADPADLAALDTYRGNRKVRRIGPFTYVIWN